MDVIKVKGMPKRAIAENEEITVSVWVHKQLNTDKVRMLYCKKNWWLNTQSIEFEFKKETLEYKVFSKTFSFEQYEEKSEYVHYCCFELQNFSGTYNWVKLDHNFKPTLDERERHWDITVYNKEYKIPEWIKGGIMYQIFVDRFFKAENEASKKQIPGREYCEWSKVPPKWSAENGEFKNNEFYNGNLEGIQKKLGYLSSLGVTVLYLTPINYAKSNHRYDALDYSGIDPNVGTWEDLKKLCKEAEKYGIAIILDYSFNHTSNESDYIKNTDWYQKLQDGNFCFWWGFGSLIVLNKDNQEFQKYIFGREGIVKKILSCGVKGIRLDVADDLTDYFIAGTKSAMNDVTPDNILYGEVWDNAVKKSKDNRQRKFLLGKWLDSVMNYPIMDALLRYIRYGNSQYLKSKFEEIYKDYPAPAKNALMNIIGTHDTARAINILVGEHMKESFTEYNDEIKPKIWDMEENSPWRYYYNNQEGFDTQSFRAWEANNEICGEMYELGKKLLKIIAVIQFFLPGIPCIYYGDEVGMTGYKDPFNRKTYPWGTKQICQDILKFYKELGKVRHECKDIVAEGEFRIIELEDEYITFERISKKSKIIIAVNRTDVEIDNVIPYEYLNEAAEVIFSLNNSNKIELGEHGAVIIKLNYKG